MSTAPEGERISTRSVFGESARPRWVWRALGEKGQPYPLPSLAANRSCSHFMIFPALIEVIIILYMVDYHLFYG